MNIKIPDVVNRIKDRLVRYKPTLTWIQKNNTGPVIADTVTKLFENPNQKRQPILAALII
jgi:hypothetical protein